jgi:hypothetical protein
MAGKIMADLGVRLSAQVGELIKGLDQANKSISGFKANMDQMGKQLIQRFFGIEAAMQAFREGFNFTKESLKMAADAEGIYRAFDKISNRAFLEQMKEATRGIFNSKELAEYAVRANNLGIKMQDLATLSKYAISFSIRSGKPAVEVLDNAILAVGRGASKGLVQIGLATEAFDKAYEKVGNKSQAIINIMKDDLKKYGEVANTTAISLLQMGATLGDLQLAYGNMLANSAQVKSVFGWLVTLMEMLTDSRLTGWEKLLGQPKEYEAFKKDMEWIVGLSDQDLRFNIELYMNGTKVGTKVKGSNYLMLDELRKAAQARGLEGIPGVEPGKIEKDVATLNTLNTELLVLTNSFKELDITDKKGLQTTANKIKALKEQIRVIEELIAVTKKEKETFEIRPKDIEIFQNAASNFGLSMTKIAERESILPKFFPSGESKEYIEKEFGIALEAYDAIRLRVAERMKGSPISLIVEQINKEATQLGIDMQNLTGIMQDGMTNLVSTFAEGVGRLAGGLEEVNLGEGLYNALSQMLIQLGNYMIRISPIITSIKVALSTLSGGMLFLGGVSLVAIGGALAGMASRTKYAGNVPKLAEGGLAYGSIYANVGEYAGAKTNPEVIAPLSKLQSILSKSMGGGTVVFEIQGDKLVGVLNNAGRLQKSYR